MGMSAKISDARVTPRKMRPLCNAIRGKSAAEAIVLLTHQTRRGAKVLLKLVKSAMANAGQKGNVDVDHLYIKELLCDKGMTLKRWMPRARGSASPILKRSSHIKVVLGERT